MMKTNKVLWSCILGIFVVYPAVTKRHSQCAHPGGCAHLKTPHLSTMRRSSQRSKGDAARQKVYSVQRGRSSVQKNDASPRTTKDNTALKLAVETLAKDIIVLLVMKESAIGIHLTEYRNSIMEGFTAIENLTSTWSHASPNVTTFLASLSNVLDFLKVGSTTVTYDLLRIQKLETDPAHPLTQIIRLNYKYSHMDDAYVARDLRNGLDAGTYELSYELGAAQILKKISDRNETCKENCHTRLEGTDWWGPIIRVQEHLKYSNLWMTFFEELSPKLENVESQVEPRKNFQGEFSRWKQGKNITTENIMEALDRMVKEYNLYSIRNNIPEIVATANKNRLRYLNEIVRICLHVKPLCSIKSNVAYVAAPYLLMSQVLNCTRYLTMIDSKINYVAAIASARFYVDDDLHASSIRSPNLELGKGFHVVVISPEWIVVGGLMRTINLNGRMPPDYDSKSQDNSGGKPGMPGEEGGWFFSFGTDISGGNLTIASNGGNGGNGQNAEYNIKNIKFSCLKQHQRSQYGEACCSTYHIQFYAPGLHGGKAGIGAPPGNYQTFGFNNESQNKIQFQNQSGQAGVVGQGSHYFTYRPGYYSPYYLELSQIYKSGEYFCSVRSGVRFTLPLTDAEHLSMNGQSGMGYIQPSQPAKISFDHGKAVSAILRYKIFSRKHSHLFNARKIHDFIARMDLDEEICNLYSTIDLINEFNALVTDRDGDYFDTEILKLSYQSLGARALARTKNYTGNDEDDHVRVLLFLSSAVRSKLLAISNPYEPVLVVNIEDFLTVEKSRVYDLKTAVEEQLQYEHITNAVSSYNDMIIKHFEEATYLIDNTINPEFDAIEMKLGQFTQALLEIIKELKKDEEKNKEILKKHREKLKSHQTGNLVSGILTTIGDAANVFVSLGGALSAGVNLGNSIANPDPGKPPVKPVKIPEAVASANRNSALRFRRSTGYSLSGFKRQLDAIQMTLSPHREAFPNAFRVIESISTKNQMRATYDPSAPMDDFPPADCILSFKNLRSTESMIKQLQRNVSDAVQLDAANANKTRFIWEVIKKVAEVVTVLVNGAAKTYNQWKQDEANIDEITNAIASTDQNIIALQNHIDRIEMEMLPAMKDLFEGLSDVRQDLASQSSIALIVIRHKMQAAIRDAQVDFKKNYVEGTGLEEYFERGLQSLENAMDTLITIYERLDAYKEQGKLANFTAEVALHPKQYLEKLNDTALQKKFDQLRYTLQGEVHLKRQSLVEGAYRMWKFPMVDPVLCEYKNLSASSLDFSTYEQVYNFLTAIEKRIDNLIQIVRISKSSIVPGDKYILKTEFTRTDRSHPFYKWTNSSSSEFVASILEGHLTFLHSDPFPGVSLCEAVKFSRVVLSFGSVTGDTNLEEKLNNILKNYLVILTHGGNSNYLFANQTFLIAAEKSELLFSFELIADGSPKIRNNVYEKLLKGDLTLSPYATWGIILQPIESDFGFKPLAEFAYKLDMYLEGFGSCVRKSFAVEGNYVSPTCEDKQLAKSDAAAPARVEALSALPTTTMSPKP